MQKEASKERCQEARLAATTPAYHTYLLHLQRAATYGRAAERGRGTGAQQQKEEQAHDLVLQLLHHVAHVPYFTLELLRGDG